MVDHNRRTGIFGLMLKRSLQAAMRGALEDVVSPQFQELRGRMDRLEAKLDEQGKRLDGRIDRLDDRVHELSLQQGRMIEQIATLRSGFDCMTVLSRRVDRLEDRLFNRPA